MIICSHFKACPVSEDEPKGDDTEGMLRGSRQMVLLLRHPLPVPPRLTRQAESSASFWAQVWSISPPQGPSLYLTGGCSRSQQPNVCADRLPQPPGASEVRQGLRSTQRCNRRAPRLVVASFLLLLLLRIDLNHRIFHSWDPGKKQTP